jgi:hypothetical protein
MMYNINFVHYKEFYPFQHIHLWLMSKSIIFAIIDATLFYGI